MFIYCIYIRPQPYRKFFQREDEPCLIYIWFGYLPWWTVGKMKYLQHSSSFTVSPPSNQTPIQLHQSVIQMILVYQTYRKETKMVNCVRSKKQPKQSLTGKTKLLLQHFNQMNFHNTQANVVDFAGIFPPRKHSLSSQHTSNTSSTSSTHTHTHTIQDIIQTYIQQHTQRLHVRNILRTLTLEMLPFFT